MIQKRWRVAPPIPAELLSQFKGYSPIMAQVLYNRGIQTLADIEHFFYDKDIAVDPFVFKDMRKAIDRITKAVKSSEKIAVYGDFDADGVTATTLMMQVLKALKADATAYIPHRVDEGYGLNVEALEKLAADGAKLVITVDCGIRSIEEVHAGNAAGLDIIITDHHSIGHEIPSAYAVVNPQQEDCPGDSNLAGVGVAFMVARALLLDGWRRNGSGDKRPYERLVEQLLDLVAIGTVADIMPLNSPLNRRLVRRGLEVIRRAERPGIKALIEVSGIRTEQITASTIGFVLGPRINAAGRLDHAMTAYELLSARNYKHALEYAEQLQTLNQKRQSLTREAQIRIQGMIEAEEQLFGNLIFAADQAVSPGIVGLVAGRLTEAYYRPAIILDQGPEESHASCRSIPEFHITQALDGCADLLIRHGGHAQAAGFTVRNQNIDTLRQRLQQKADEILTGLELIPVLDIDVELALRDLNEELVQELGVLEPTGHKNEMPIFLSRRLRVHEYRTVGTDNQHLKLIIAADGANPIDCIGFRLGIWADNMPELIDAVYHLEINEWQGRRNLQLNLKDLRPSTQDSP